MLRVFLAALVVEFSVFMLKIGCRLAGRGGFEVNIDAPYDCSWDYLAFVAVIVWALV